MPRYFAGLLALAIFGGCGGDQSSGGTSNGGASGASASGGTAGSSGGAAGSAGASGGAGGTAGTAGIGGVAGGGQGGTAGSDGGVQDSGSGDAIADAPFDASKNYQAWADYCTACSLTYCMHTIDCYEGWFTEEVVTAYVACRTASCSTADDPCAASAQASVPVTAAGTDLFNTCQAKVSSCGGTFTFPCAASFFSSVLPSIQTSYKSCFAGPCADVKSCLKAARPAACNGAPY